MQQLPFILVTIGIICIIISFLLPDKEKKRRQEKGEQLTPEERANLIAQGKKEIDGILNNKAEDAIEKVDEQLSRISNEKIISVSEYSDQVLEKINQNHQEVVFLYNMLNEKEEEMKKLMSKMKTGNTMDEKQIEQLAKRAKEVSNVSQRQDVILQKGKSESKSAYFGQSETQNQNRTQNEIQSEIQNNEDIEMLRELIYDNKEKEKPAVSSFEYREQGIQQNLEQNEESLTKQVVEMHQNGMSILEISKQLHKGQGEVRLIIDLYARR